MEARTARLDRLKAAWSCRTAAVGQDEQTRLALFRASARYAGQPAGVETSRRLDTHRGGNGCAEGMG